MSAPELPGRRELWLTAAAIPGGYGFIPTMMPLTLLVLPYVVFAA